MTRIFVGAGRSTGIRPQDLVGAITGEFLIGYALMRCLGELFREPDQDVALILGIFSRGTFYSFFMLAAGAALIVGVRLRQKT